MSLEIASDQVWRQRFWMAGWGAETPKATTLYANTRGIRIFRTCSKHAKARPGARSLVDRSTGNKGVRNFKGNGHLKGSQSSTELLLQCFAAVWN